MHAGVFAEFGMECCRHNSSLPDCDGIIPLGGNYFDAWAHALNLRGADKNHLDRLEPQPAFANRAINLPTVGVAADADIERSQS